MRRQKPEPETKEQFGAVLNRPAAPGKTPPQMRKGMAHAPAQAVRIERPSDRSEIPIITAHADPMMMEIRELREFMGKAEYIDNRANIDPNRFANGMMLSRPKSEGSRGARYIAINMDDGSAWRLYPQTEALASTEKFEKCQFRAMLRAGGEYYQLYWETPELR